MFQANADEIRFRLYNEFNPKAFEWDPYYGKTYCPKFLTIRMNNSIYQSEKLSERFGGNYSAKLGESFPTHERILIATPLAAIKPNLKEIPGMFE